MAENIVDALIVTMGLDNSDYERGMNEVEDRTRQFSERAPRDVERGLNSIEQRFGATFQGIFRTFIAPLTAALGTMGIFSQYTQTADRIGKTAARIGASAEDLQAFGEAAKRAGGSVEGFISSFESLNGQIQRMQAMGGKGRLTPILEQLGISATENGKAKDTFQILRELAGASERIGKQKFAGLARFLGLDQGTIMLLQSGRVAMDELIARQRALGVYTKEDFEITAKFNDAISDLQQSFRAMAAPILQVITPALTTLAGWLTKIVQTFREHQGFIVAGLTVIAATMSGVLLKAATALGAALAPLLGPIAAVAGLGAIFDEIATYAEGGETAFQGLWEAIGTPEDFKAVGQAVQDFASGAWEAISGLAKDVGGVFVDVMSEWGAKIEEWIKALPDKISKALTGIWETLRGWWTTAIDWMSKKWDSFIQTVTGWMPDALKKQIGIKVDGDAPAAPEFKPAAIAAPVARVLDSDPQRQALVRQLGGVVPPGRLMTALADAQAGWTAKDIDKYLSQANKQDTPDPRLLALATITSRAPDAAQIRQDNSRKTTVNVKNDTIVNNRFEGVTDGNAAGLMNDAANSTQRAVERGNSFALGNGTAAFNSGVFGS